MGVDYVPIITTRTSAGYTFFLSFFILFFKTFFKYFLKNRFRWLINKSVIPFFGLKLLYQPSNRLHTGEKCEIVRDISSHVSGVVFAWVYP